MQGRIGCWIIVSQLIFLGIAVFFVPVSVVGTGDLGNEPALGYEENSEEFDILLGATATTSFNPGDTITVKISTVRVNIAGNGQNENELYLTDIRGVPVAGPVEFNQYSVGTPYTYRATITAPNTPDHYLLNARIIDDNSNQFTAKDVIIVQGSDTNEKYIKTYSDITYSTLDWTFESNDIIYIEVYAEETPHNVQSTVKFTDYSGGESSITISDLAENGIIPVNNHIRIQYDLASDLDIADLTDGNLNEGYWYGLTVDLRKGNGDEITADWTIQIQITAIAAPSITVHPGVTQAVPDIVEREGIHTTTISTQFQDTDELSIDSYTITFKVRDENDDEIVIVDRKKDGQEGEFGGTLNVETSASGIYTASYDLDPDSTFITGDYDLYFKVEDNTGEWGEDSFQDNEDELQITSSTSPPQVSPGATQCIPDTVDRIGEHVTRISTQFTDSDSLSVDDFTVLFKLRDPDNDEIVLVENKTNGEDGEMGGTLFVTTSAQGIYTAYYEFDPDGSFAVGDYDLYFKVTDQHGNSATDNFNRNRDGLEITSSAMEPILDPGTTEVTPKEVDKSGDGITTISANFVDIDSFYVSNFTVTFKIRDEEGNEYILVDSAKNGEEGEYNGKVVITESSSSPNHYEASYAWNPPDDMPNGNYSLYFKVEDDSGVYAEDGYENNVDELLISGEEKEPKEASIYPLILLLILLLIILFIIIFAIKNKKGKEEQPPAEPQIGEEDESKPESPPKEEDSSPPTSPPSSSPQSEPSEPTELPPLTP